MGRGGPKSVHGRGAQERSRSTCCAPEHFERVEAFIAAVTLVVESAGRCVE